MNGKKRVKDWITKGLLSVLLVGTVSGCTSQAALEDRTYVESLHITPEGEAYRFQCILAYMDSQSLEQLKAGLDGAVTSEEAKEGQDSGKKDSMTGNAASAENSPTEEINEYTAVANDIEDFNEEYYRITGSNFDYSHLQGIYLDSRLYRPELAEDILEEIREETQVVLSTPIYEEGVDIGDQREETIGDWLKETRG